MRVHADPAAARSARAVDAAAYTVANHIVFGPNAYNPSTSEGSRLLAHELAHVVQQSPARSVPPARAALIIGSRDDPLEHEATRAVERLDGTAGRQERLPSLAREGPQGGRQHLRRQSADDQKKKNSKPWVPLPHPLDSLDLKPMFPLPGGFTPPTMGDIEKGTDFLRGQKSGEPAGLGCLAGWNLRKGGTGAGMCCQGFIYDKDKCCPPSRMRVTHGGATCAPAPISKEAPTGKPAPESKPAPPAPAPGKSDFPLRLPPQTPPLVVDFPIRFKHDQPGAIVASAQALRGALTEAGSSNLDQVINWLKRGPDFSVQLTGMASTEGTPAHNQLLGEYRARSIAERPDSKRHRRLQVHRPARRARRVRLASRGHSQLRVEPGFSKYRPQRPAG